ncbi:type I methionyl aminopeptidase [Glycomyces salinus]|uniref:type I methionyl aminopeptidase n=1 Tax=Glycomyces salinus TaxID=980294 RepID=UPI0027DA9FFE|nr:type I methionyl aminopeptidase [Glycomyces salinus]
MFRRRRWAIQLKTPDQIVKMRAAGLVVAEVHRTVREAAAPGVSTAELDRIAEDVIRGAGAVPSFKGYDIGSGPYPASICSSLNDQVVHAIPSKEAVLAEGDLLSVDVGAVLDGWHGDAAITIEVGEVRPELTALREACEASMWAGIRAAATVRRLGGISNAIERSVESSGEYGIVTGFGGHGIGTEMHQDPHVLNYGDPNTGPKLRTGMCLAIEPMITLGDPDTAELDDGWTIVTDDGSIAAHTEHSIAICEDGVWVLTAPDGGVGMLGELTASAARAELLAVS